MSFSTAPSVVGGAATTVTVTYATSASSISDITGGTVQIDGCNIEWDTVASDVRLDTGGTSNYKCTILSQTAPPPAVSGNPQALAMQFVIKFSEINFLGSHEVYSWAMNAEGLESPSVDLGALVVNQGQDFTLSMTPTGDPNYWIHVSQTTPVYFTLSSSALNGYSGAIALTYPPQDFTSFPYCFNFTYGPDVQHQYYQGLPTSMNAGDQIAIGLTNSCSTQQQVEFIVQGSASGVGSRSSPAVYLLGQASSDFTITVGGQTPTTLTYQSQVFYPVTLGSLYHAAGTVNLSVAAAPGSTLPAGISCSIPSSVSLPMDGSANTTLTCSGAANTPGGSFPIVVNGTLGYTTHSAQATLTTQVITFTSSNAPPVLNNGIATTITLTPSATLPTLTSCDANGDPNVSCTVSTGGGSVSVVITAGTNATHGVRTIRFNGGALSAQVNVHDMSQVVIIPDVPALPAGSNETVQFTVEDLDLIPCEIDGPCPYFTVGAGGFATVEDGPNFGVFELVVAPPPDTEPGTYWIPLSVCEWFDSDQAPDASCVDAAISVLVLEAATTGPVPSLIVTTNGQVVVQGTCNELSFSQALLIAPNPNQTTPATPAMPAISAQIVMSDGSTPMGTATWTFSGWFPQHNNNTVQNTPWGVMGPPPIVPASQPFTNPWTAINGFVGGNATIGWTYNGVQQAPYYLCILGANPTTTDSMYVLNAAASSSGYWFVPEISIQETRLNQFCQPGATGTYCANGANQGWPIWGSPAGYGIMQTDPPSSTDMIWNWTSAINAGVQEISQKAGPPHYTNGDDQSAYPFWIRQVQQWWTYNTVTAPALGLSTVPAPPDQTESPACTFTLAVDSNGNPIQNIGKANTYWFGDAVLIKQYNGASHQYISWNTPPGVQPYWFFNKGNGESPNYVQDVCTCTDPSGSGCQHSRY